MPGRLYLLPNLLFPDLPLDHFLPKSVFLAVEELSGLIAEDEREGRRYLRKFLSHERLQKIPISLLNKHQSEVSEFVKRLEKGEVLGLVCDAGLPCIADPGFSLVALAQQKKIEIRALSGPCSLTMALQLSGFSGRRFTFHGYLPKEAIDLEKAFRKMAREKTTHIWIETPYRGDRMLEIAKITLPSSSRLALAIQLSSPEQKVIVKSIEKWRKIVFHLGKVPTVFLCEIL